MLNLLLSFIGSFLGSWIGLEALKSHFLAELERKMTGAYPKDEYSILEASSGAEIIMPNPIKEAFDNGRIKNIGDIL